MSKKKLGEILIDAGSITPQQLMDALKDQQVFGGRLGTILLEKCAIKEDEYFRVLTSILGIPAVDLHEVTIPESVIKLVPMEVAWNFMVLPVEVKKSSKNVSLVLAMADPTNVSAINEIQMLTNYKIEPALALESTLRFILMDYYQNQYGKGDYHLEKKIPPKCEEDASSLYKVSESIDREPPKQSFVVDPLEDSGIKDEPSGKSAAAMKTAMLDDMIIERQERLYLEVKALIRLLSKKGVINPKEYMEVLRDLKATEFNKK